MLWSTSDSEEVGDLAVIHSTSDPYGKVVPHLYKLCLWEKVYFLLRKPKQIDQNKLELKRYINLRLNLSYTILIQLNKSWTLEIT